MKIGIKYCGGCNPRYERTNIAERLRLDLPEARIVSASSESQMDYVVIICGCMSACANVDGLMGEYGRSIITHHDAYKELLEKLKQVMREKEK
ncbi:MAG: hypothetical protein VB082_01745 [Christensenella sp.]|nr:hypothetical protein [Christensenella sp.]